MYLIQSDSTLDTIGFGVHAGDVDGIALCRMFNAAISTQRLIGTIRREYLDRVFFWNAVDLERKLDTFLQYYNHARVHQSLGGNAPGEMSDIHQSHAAQLSNYSWISHCNGLFQTPIAA